MIEIALLEDMPLGDITTDGLLYTHREGKARLVAKQDLNLSGKDFFTETLNIVDPSLKLTWHFEDGQKVYTQQNVCTIYGNLVNLLKAERVALNYIMHLSGIATLASQFVEAVKPYPCKILDTRKTFPGFRMHQKKAVIDGGGQNHRMNLSSAILIKDNHINMVGGITEAVLRLRKTSDLPIEVEAATAEQVLECVRLKVNRILLDNMSNELIKKCLEEIPSDIETEASGNMTLDRVQSVAATGVNFISVGALTHSAKAADLSLQFQY